MLRIMTLVALLVLITLLGATKALGWVPEGHVTLVSKDTTCGGMKYSPFVCELDIKQGVIESHQCNIKGVVFIETYHTISSKAEGLNFIILSSKNRNQQLLFNTRTLDMTYVDNSKAKVCTASYYYYDEKEIK